MSRTVLITGATGNVSSALVDVLQGSDLHLRALVRDTAKAAPLRAKGVTLFAGNLDDSASLAPAFEGVDELWLLTAMGPRAPENSMNAVWAARQAGVKRIVRLSAIGAAHDAPTRNGRLHALSDHEVQQSGLRWTILRPHYFMQNLLGAAATIADHGALYQNVGQGRLGMVDVRDIADTAARVLLEESDRHDGRIYTLTGPQSLSFEQVAGQLGRSLGRAVNYVPTSDEATAGSLIELGLGEWIAGMIVEYGRAYAAGWGDFVTGHVRDVLGRDPRSLAEFARDHAAAFGA